MPPTIAYKDLIMTRATFCLKDLSIFFFYVVMKHTFNILEADISLADDTITSTESKAEWGQIIENKACF